MPRTTKYDKEYILAVALALAEEKGPEALTARGVAQRAGCSVVPIFQCFKSMDELFDGVREEAQKVYSRYIDAAMCVKPTFKAVGEEYLRFAKEHPNLFKLLFMNDAGGVKIDDALQLIEHRYDEILNSVTELGLSADEAVRLYKHMWIYTHGIAVLCVTSTCAFTEEELSAMMTDVFLALMKRIKENRL